MNSGCYHFTDTIYFAFQRKEEEKRKPLARKLIKRFPIYIIPPEKTIEERALHILSLARVKFRMQQVGTASLDDVIIASCVVYIRM